MPRKHAAGLISPTRLPAFPLLFGSAVVDVVDTPEGSEVAVDDVETEVCDVGVDTVVVEEEVSGVDVVVVVVVEVVVDRL